jgi:hypothetical protein
MSPATELTSEIAHATSEIAYEYAGVVSLTVSDVGKAVRKKNLVQLRAAVRTARRRWFHLEPYHTSDVGNNPNKSSAIQLTREDSKSTSEKREIDVGGHSGHVARQTADVGSYLN